ncbi:hypothetical protein EZJ43_14960 [Pedobacter changchengzhani]|uniref:Uncharacterized protein n=1 Tax=Pedobacter changchengzhani TaxID=2529274 RepID=A0A4R5MIK1_9SPHI|nr:hypothetical protein [Pedobacter changchengzhani]TDG35196.1 hypothetical protein EZJ43_14960 [Pedobacter changchengzhani]
MKSSKWKTLGKDVIGAGNAGGIGIISLALNKLSPDVLRWMYAITTQNYTNEHHEMRVTNTDQVSIVTSFPTDTYKFHLKVMNDGHEWQMNADPNGQHKLFTYKDSKIIDAQYLSTDLANFPKYQGFLEIASDGFLVSGYGGGWQTATYTFQTQTWKTNWISGAGHCAQVRYRGKTIAVMVSNTQTGIYTEGDVSRTDNYKTVFPMKLLKSMPTPQSKSGDLVYSVTYGKSFYMAMEDGNSIRLFKLDLETLDFVLVQDITLSARLESGTQQMFYDQTVLDNNNQIAVDETGNIYVNERNNQKYSIRKFLVTGGSEVVLKTEEMKDQAAILSIRYFNGKLYAGVFFRELDQSINTDYFQHYLQLVRQL